MAWIMRNAFNRTDNLTLWFAIMSNTLGAQVGIDFVNLLSHVNGFIWAFGFAHIAIDAFVGDDERHNDLNL